MYPQHGVTNAQSTREVAQLVNKKPALVFHLAVQPHSPDGDAKKDDVANFHSST